jgi:hypothetical protein
LQNFLALVLGFFIGLIFAIISWIDGDACHRFIACQ